MRYMIISDIHGATRNLSTVLTRFKEEHFDYLIILGDILYHGPRNPVPAHHDPQGVVNLLNPIAHQIIACRGNCEAEVDQMLLQFPCLGDYTQIIDEGIRIFATHGHLYTSGQFPKVPGKQIFLYGHTHLWELKWENEVLVCNPGSITLPKENRPATYATYANKVLSVYDLNHTLLSSYAID